MLRDKVHGYTDAQLSAKDAEDLANFVSKGQGTLSKYIDASNKSTGQVDKGEVYYNTICAGCHGLDGKKVKDGPALGSVADNGAEMMHKIFNGQPAESMPAMRAIEHQVAADIAAYLTKLPK
jgi:mono/diheme cytochrome c family protein